MSRRILILLFHPDIANSRVNRVMTKFVAELDGVSMHDVYAQYPDFDIDVAAEQQRCVEHEILVFQHPLQWYSCPALMKEWIDRVLAYGWAHGAAGTKLRGKGWLCAVSAGWDEPDYRASGRNQRALADFLAPLAQTAVHCGMRWLEPFAFYGARNAAPDDIRTHAERYREHLVALRDGQS